MKAQDVRVGDQRWAYGHLLFEVLKVWSDGLHLNAVVDWAPFAQHDTVMWYSNQELPGMVRPDASGSIVLNSMSGVIGNDKEAVNIGSDIARLTSWLR